MKAMKWYEYIIEINFINSSSNNILSNFSVPYYWSVSWLDSFSILDNRIVIKAIRSTIISDLDNIFTNYISSLYLQIVKSLIFYYSKKWFFYEIRDIKITLNNYKWKELKNKVLEHNNFNQILNWSFNLEYKIKDSYIKEIFKETLKWKELLITISNLLIWSCSNLKESEKFEILWKSFNSLYKLITSQNKDSEALKGLKEFIINNNIKLKNSLNIVRKLTKNFREDKDIRFREMILNNYPKETNVKALRDMIMRYNDFRLMEIFRDTKLCYREKFLKNKGFYDEVLSHINYNIDNNIKRDDELIFFITWIYMYFVRNKQFHWEILNHNFRLTTNKFDNQFEFLNSILKAYIVDLINNSDKY